MDQIQMPNSGNPNQSTSYISAVEESEPKKGKVMKWVLILLAILIICAGLYFWIFI